MQIWNIYLAHSWNKWVLTCEMNFTQYSKNWYYQNIELLLELLYIFNPSNYTREIFALHVEESATLSENSPVDHRDQLAVKVSVNILYSRGGHRRYEDDEESTSECSGGHRSACVLHTGIESDLLRSFSLASSTLLQSSSVKKKSACKNLLMQ